MNKGERTNPELSTKPDFVPYETSLAQANELYEKYWEQIAIQKRESDPYGHALADIISQIPGDTLKHFEGHGITRGTAEENIAALINIITNKTVKGWAASLGHGGYNAWTHGDFLVVSKPDVSIAPREGGKVRTNEMGMEIDIGGIIVGPKMTPLVDELRRLFPDVDIIRAAEASEYLTSKLRQHSS